MLILKSIVLGILQGMTEFLPVSSSGHLVIAKSLFQIEYSGISFEIFLHTATLFAILYVFRDKIISIAASVFNPHKEARSDDLRFLWLVLVATVPSAVSGFFWRNQVEKMFTDLSVVGIALLVTGSVIFVTRFARSSKGALGFWDAVIIGVAQAAALIPGISRSGTTISTALLLGLRRKESAQFCFILAVPAISGATILEMKNVIADTQGASLLPYICGFMAAFISGFLAIKLVLKTLRKQRFGDFAYYCWVVGVVVLFLLR